VIVATGSASALPSFLPRHPRVVDSRGFLALNRLPDSLLVLGGGVIGCEFACAAAQWGAAVTVVELLEDIVLTVDPDLRGVLRRHMEQRLGIRVLTGKPLENIAASDGGVSGTWGGEALRADGLLAAVGRQPVTAELNLAQTGLSVGTTGHIEVDEFGQTAAPRVFAVGDVTGRSQLAHAATAQGLVAAGNACGKQRRAFETVVPQCIFTAPEIGSVGLTEPQAAAAGRAVVTGKYPFAHLGKALALGETAGFVKWVADARTGQLLGAHAVGPHATELIAEATVAIRAELTVEELGRTIHCHPTLAETWMEAAHAAQGACIHLPPPRR
jgi:dihydrolipoamide dehydrogenase